MQVAGRLPDGLAGRAAGLVLRLLDLLLPPRCLACGELVDEQGRLCAGCWSSVGFLLGRGCRVCGVPLPAVAAEAAICGHCQAATPVYARARAALRYGGVARQLILRFKHGDRTDGATTFARWMARAGAELLADCDLIVPVPLHRWRLLQRGYNQSAVLAQALARQSGKPTLVDALVKLKATPSQQLLDAAARRANIRAELFALSRRGRAAVDGRRVLLIDDVLTTGSTTDACASCLIAGGATAVDVLTLARVAYDPSEPI